MSGPDFKNMSELGAKKRAENSKAINHTTLARERRKRGQIAGRTVAVQNFCRECMGFDPGDSGSLSGAVKNCTAHECWLWPWRSGPLDPDAKSEAGEKSHAKT